jgi:hypothetical protein
MPSIRQSSANHSTETQAGDEHDMGIGVITWQREDLDSEYYESAHIGDNRLDIKINSLSAEAANVTPDSWPLSAEDETEFWAGMSDSAEFEVNTVPAGLCNNEVQVQAHLDMGAQAKTSGYASSSGSLSIGGSVLGLINFDVSTPVALNANPRVSAVLVSNGTT